MIEIIGKYTTAVVMIDDVEEACLNQVYGMVSHPAFTNPIRIMPDTHAGKGSVIGFTMELSDKIVPNVVGVDIGCGMLSFKVGRPSSHLRDIDHEIKRSIPTGTYMHDRFMATPDDFTEMFSAASLSCKLFVMEYNKKFGTSYEPMKYDPIAFERLMRKIGVDRARVMNSIGTLGGGNHFIEMGVDGDGQYWVTIHTGSRKFGESVCRYHQDHAKKLLEHRRKVELAEGIREITKTHSDAPAKIEPAIASLKESLGLNFGTDINDMEFLTGQDAMEYFFDMIIAQKYAELSRKVIRRIILSNAFGVDDDVESIECVHNYIDFHDMVIRKGAIRAYSSELSIIPFNMEDGMLIVRGKDNADWNCSAPHGAGRLMSRSRAKDVLSLDDMKDGMKKAGVYSSSLCMNTLDEAKGAYKPAALIESLVSPTVDVVYKIRPVLNIKDSSAEMSKRRNKKQK